MVALRMFALLLALAVIGQGKSISPAGSNTQAKLTANGVEDKKVEAATKAKPEAPVAQATKNAAKPVSAAKPAKEAALMAYSPKISPPLHDGVMGGGQEHQSDKKFFGPPFPADYPDDKRPVPQKSIMDKLKGPDQPYPSLQSKADFDRDYVKDENSDTGSWKAQFEYDTLRNRMAKEQADARNAGDRASKEGKDVDSSQKAVDDANKNVHDAEAGVDEAINGEKKEKTAEDFEDVPPSHEKLDQLKKAVADAEAKYEQEKKEFEECEKQLEAAKKNIEELKAKQVEMEAQLSADTKLWVEQKSMRLSAKKAKEEAAHSIKVVADEKLTTAQANKAEVDKVLAAKKAVHDKAKKDLEKERAELAKAKTDLEKATLVLQKLR
jgi:DNA repair exonuclease SbcCD ATPase subunit